MKSTSTNWINFVKGNKLDVEYCNGRRYRYYNVPITTYMQIANADSRGKAIQEFLKDEGVSFVKHDKRFKMYRG